MRESIFCLEGEIDLFIGRPVRTIADAGWARVKTEVMDGRCSIADAAIVASSRSLAACIISTMHWSNMRGYQFYQRWVNDIEVAKEVFTP